MKPLRLDKDGPETMPSGRNQRGEVEEGSFTLLGDRGHQKR